MVVPASKIRKIEPNPVSIQSFLLEEEKNEYEARESEKKTQGVGSNSGGGLFNKSPKKNFKDIKETPNFPTDPNKLAGWSYIKK
jgi:hypothetical protein